MHDCPGRFNLIEVRGVSIVIDDSHNVPALAALCRALDRFPHERRTIVYSAGDGRRDVDIVHQGEQLGAAFDRVILYEDYSAADRDEGELATLFRQGLSDAKRTVEILEVPNHRRAIETALACTAPGELLVIQPEDEDIQPTLEIVRTLAGPETAAASGCFQGVDTH